MSRRNVIPWQRTATGSASVGRAVRYGPNNDASTAS